VWEEAKSTGGKEWDRERIQEGRSGGGTDCRSEVMENGMCPALK
jgi:hypothetical protein